MSQGGEYVEPIQERRKNITLIQSVKTISTISFLQGVPKKINCPQKLFVYKLYEFLL